MTPPDEMQFRSTDLNCVAVEFVAPSGVRSIEAASELIEATITLAVTPVSTMLVAPLVPDPNRQVKVPSLAGSVCPKGLDVYERRSYFHAVRKRIASTSAFDAVLWSVLDILASSYLIL
jgi:hypothetical protein